VSEDKTAETLHLPSFEDRVLALLEAVSSRIATLEKRVGEIDADTKPNWERLHRDFAGFHTEMTASFGNLVRKLDVVNKELFQLKADQEGVETRLEKIELEVRPQIIVQNRQF
jgi:hypothetical protein